MANVTVTISGVASGQVQVFDSSAVLTRMQESKNLIELAAPDGVVANVDLDKIQVQG